MIFIQDISMVPFNFQNDPTYVEVTIVISTLHKRKMRYRDIMQLTHHYIDTIMNVHWFLCWISSALGSRNKKLFLGDEN